MKLRPLSKHAAFTLVEVVLAILIISGIMLVLLYFYQRAAETREAAMKETEFISTTRLFLEQLTTELRAARVIPEEAIGFNGTSNSISFVCTGLPQGARWIVSTNEPPVNQPLTDLKLVRYRLITGTNSFETLGIDRKEEWIINPSAVTAPVEEVVTDVLGIETTNIVAETSSTNLSSTNQIQLAAPPLTELIRFIQFRYWDGHEWIDSWGGTDLPAGVEVSLGRDPMPREDTGESYPYEIFRRVIYLPHSAPIANQVVLEPLEEEGMF